MSDQPAPGFYWVRQKFAGDRLSVIEVCEGVNGGVYFNLLGTTDHPWSWKEALKSFEIIGRIEEPSEQPTEQPCA